MGFLSKLLGLSEWKTESRFPFIISKEVYGDVVELSKKHHPNEFFFYIISELKDNPNGKIFVAKKVIESTEWDSGPFGSEKRATTKNVALPSVEEVKKLAGKLGKKEVLVLCHSHNAEEDGDTNMLKRVRGAYRPFISRDINCQISLVHSAGITLDRVLFGIFLMPKEKEKKAYKELYAGSILSILIVKAPDKREKLTLSILSKKPS